MEAVSGIGGQPVGSVDKAGIAQINEFLCVARAKKGVRDDHRAFTFRTFKNSYL
jgi:hypothetical protein